MKTSNRLLLTVLSVIVIGSLVIMLKVGSILSSETEDVFQIQGERFVINRQMDQQGLDSMQERISQDGGKLKLKVVEFNDRQELTTLKGEVKYECCSQSFDVEKLEWMSIQKGQGILKVSYNSSNQSSFSWEGDL